MCIHWSPMSVKWFCSLIWVTLSLIPSFTSNSILLIFKVKFRLTFLFENLTLHLYFLFNNIWYFLPLPRSMHLHGRTLIGHHFLSYFDTIQKDLLNLTIRTLVRCIISYCGQFYQWLLISGHFSILEAFLSIVDFWLDLLIDSISFGLSNTCEFTSFF